MEQGKTAYMSMYEHFYNLRENPFSDTVDPGVHFVDSSTREAMASILHGVRSRKGFMTLVGEPGTGKTTLLRRLADELSADTQVAMLFNSGVTFDELLEFICIALGIVLDDSRRLTRLTRLNEYLLDTLCAGRNVVVIIDDAQTLDDKVLEELRLLTNLETAKEKILQVILSGQPELEDKLGQYHLRQVRQRIGVRARLERLAAGDVGDYVATRLSAVGSERQDLFTPRDLKRVWKATRGIPRAINLVCDQALATAFTRGERPVATATIKQAISNTCNRPDAPDAPDSPRSWARSGRGSGMRPMMYAVAALAVVSCVPVLTAFVSDEIRERTEYSAPAEIMAARPVAQAAPRVETPGGWRALAAVLKGSDTGFWKPDRIMPTELVIGLLGECGNGLIERGEQCDDGNHRNDDSCLVGCVPATCGDGFVHVGVELCDDGNDVDTDACLASCVPARCGDAIVRLGVEECDDGVRNNDAVANACRVACVAPFCGDGVVDRGEFCDAGNAAGSDGCSSRCLSVAPGHADALVRPASLARTRPPPEDGRASGHSARRNVL